MELAKRYEIKKVVVLVYYIKTNENIEHGYKKIVNFF